MQLRLGVGASLRRKDANSVIRVHSALEKIGLQPEPPLLQPEPIIPRAPGLGEIRPKSDLEGRPAKPRLGAGQQDLPRESEPCDFEPHFP